MNMTNMNNPKPWAEGHPSLYEGHDITHRPDWANIIVWDAFFNNLTAGFMVLTGIAWFAGPPLFAALLPFALTLALLIVIVDLVLLVFDLGDPPRFIHAMRVLHFTSPLSVGVWGLACYATCLGCAVGIYWLSVYSVATNDFLAPYIAWLDILMRLFTVLAFIGAVVVICYKGVAFQLHLSARRKESSLADLFHGVGCPSNGLRTLCDYGCLFRLLGRMRLPASAFHHS